MRLRRRTSEAGESLIEVLVAVTILGLGVTALLGGMATAVFGTSLHRDQADVSEVMTAAAERVKDTPYVACAEMDDYLDPTGADPFAFPGHVVTIAAVDTLNVASPGGTPRYTVRFAIKDWYGDQFLPRPDMATCQQFHDEGARLQRITITASTADSQVSQALPVVKRYNDCRPPLPRPGCDTT